MRFLTDYDPHKKRFCSIIPLLAVGAGMQAAGSSIFSGIMGSKGADKQAKKIEEQAALGRETALELNRTARAEYDSYAQNYLGVFKNRGDKAGNALMSLLTGEMDISNLLQESDLYKFESNLGQRDINRQLKARGLYGSGAGLEALSRFSSELTAKEGQRHWDRLIAGYTELSRQGLQAGGQVVAGAASLGGATTALGGNLANTTTQAGIAQGSAIADKYNAIGGIGQGIAQSTNQFAGNLMQYNLLKPLLEGMSGAGPGAPGGVSASVESPATAPLGMNSDNMDLIGRFGMFG